MVPFDACVVDVTDRLDDPLHVIFSVKLGGATDIGRAVARREGVVEDPARTVPALVGDLCEGAAPSRLPGAVARLDEARARMVGLAAPHAEGRAAFDRGIAGQVVERGMAMSATMPDRFAGWFAAQPS